MVLEVHNLVDDERDQRGDDDSAPWTEEGGALVRERLSSTCWHDTDDIPPVHIRITHSNRNIRCAYNKQRG